jgi:uncharacterized protein
MKALFFVFVIGLCSFSAKSEDTGGATIERKTPVPKLESWVNDKAGVLSVEDRERLVKLLKNYEQETKHQIAVLIIPTLAGEPIESFCLRTANKWRLGRKDIDDGALVCMAMKERMVRIELGIGMNRYISNADASEIITTEMTPLFSKGDFAGGLERGLKRLMEEGRRFVAMNCEASQADRVGSDSVGLTNRIVERLSFV